MLFSYHLLYFCTALSLIIMLSSHYHHHKSKTFSQLTQCPFTGTLLLSYYFCQFSLTAKAETPYLFMFREILNLAKEFGRSPKGKHLMHRYFNIDRYGRQKYGLISICILLFDTNTSIFNGSRKIKHSSLYGLHNYVVS